jgi:hypothetical protein
MIHELDPKYKKMYYILAALSIYIIILTKDFLFSFEHLGAYRVYGSIFIAIYMLVLNHLLFKSARAQKFVWWGVYYIGIFIVELLTIGVLVFVLRISMTEIITNKTISLWASLGNKILTLLLFELFIRRRKSKFEIKTATFNNIFILIAFNVILIFGGVAVFTNVYNTEIDLYTVIQYILVAILLTTLVTFSLIFKIEKESKKEIETRLKLQQIELELKQNKDIINITDNLRKLRHDMNNHIGLIKSLIYDQKYDELREYVDDLYQDVAVANEYIVLENKVLSVLLNSKREKAKELEVDFQSFVAASDINIPEKDICVLFGNILDNAIEAASKAVNSKFVTMSIQKTESGCIIQCENSIGEKPLIKKGKFLTSKSDKNLHGIGTENIIDVVNKYNGKIKFDFDEEVFSIRIVMPT